MTFSFRRLHRLTSLVFVLMVAAIFGALASGRQPAQWVYYLPLAPLFVLTASGLVLLIRPWISGAGRRAPLRG